MDLSSLNLCNALLKDEISFSFYMHVSAFNLPSTFCKQFISMSLYSQSENFCMTE